MTNFMKGLNYRFKSKRWLYLKARRNHIIYKRASNSEREEIINDYLMILFEIYRRAPISEQKEIMEYLDEVIIATK